MSKYQEKDDEYDYYRELYIKAIGTQQFPWVPAYYYYMQNIDRIDVMSFVDFQEDILAMSSLCQDTETAFEQVTQPIYDTLDHYFGLNQLISKDNKILKLI